VLEAELTKGGGASERIEEELEEWPGKGKNISQTKRGGGEIGRGEKRKHAYNIMACNVT